MPQPVETVITRGAEFSHYIYPSSTRVVRFCGLHLVVCVDWSRVKAAYNRYCEWCGAFDLKIQ